MKTRILLGTALILAVAALIAGDVFTGFKHPIGFSLLCLVATVVGLKECANLLRRAGLDMDFPVAVIGALVAIAMATMSGSQGIENPANIYPASSHALIEMIMGQQAKAERGMVVGLIVVLLLSAFRGVWGVDVRQFPARFAGTLAAYCLIVVPTAMMVSMRGAEHVGLWLVVWLIVVCRLGSDSGAYFVGKALGRTRLIPHVSPGKTVEGAIGGLVVATVLGLAMWKFTPLHDFLWPQEAGLLAFLTALACANGDLAESALKRAANTKDSGRLLPEFGGVLDVIDGFLLAAPLVYLFLRMRPLWAC